MEETNDPYAVFETRVCIDKGEKFDVTFKDKEFYESKGYALPKRCLGCRKALRAMRENNNDQ